MIPERLLKEIDDGWILISKEGKIWQAEDEWDPDDNIIEVYNYSDGGYLDVSPDDVEKVYGPNGVLLYPMEIPHLTENVDVLPGDSVRIIDEPPPIDGRDYVSMIPGISASIDWIEPMNEMVGKKVSVESVKDDGLILVSFGSERYRIIPDWIAEVNDKVGKSFDELKTNTRDATPLELWEKEMAKRFPGRKDAIHVAHLGLLSGLPVFFLGPPGTAKSMILESIAKSLNLSIFVKLITDYTLPEELFGPVNVPEMKKGRWKRITTGFLPESNVVFLDEIFKSTTILNTLLRVINEKKFRNGDEDMDVPLYAFFAASNEIPSDPSLLALYDRLALRIVTDTITDPYMLMEMKKASSDKSWTPPKYPVDIDKARKEVQEVEIPDDILRLATDIELKIMSKGVIISNRKQVQLMDILKAEAYIHGRKKVSIYDLHVMKYVYWNVLEDISVVENLIQTEITPSLSALRDAKVKASQTIIDYGDRFESNIQYQMLVWKTVKTYLERIPEPRSEEEKEILMQEIADFLEDLERRTPLLKKRSYPRFRW